MAVAVAPRRRVAREVAVYLALTTALTTLIYVWMFHGGGNSPAPVAIMMWVPGITALATSLLLGDRLASYGWRPGDWRLLGAAYALPIAVALLAYGVFWLTPLGEFSADQVRNYKWAAMLGFTRPAPFVAGFLSKAVLAFLFTLPFALGEEIGWSGFLVRKLLAVTSVPVTALVAGGYWAVWHVPAIVGGLYGPGAPLWSALPGFALMCVASFLVRATLLSRGQSVWVGATLHASANVFYMGMFWEMTVRRGAAALLVSEVGVFSGLVFLGVAVLFRRFSARGRPAAAYPQHAGRVVAAR